METFDRRLLESDALPNEVITKDKKSILVDNYTRWRIVDPLQVYQVARTQTGVASRMQDVVRGKVRELLGQHTLHEIVSGGDEATLRVEGEEHASTRSLPAEWIRTDEWYNIRHVNEDVHVVLSIDEIGSA